MLLATIYDGFRYHSQTDITDEKIIEYIQKGYEYVVKKLRLDPSVLPVYMTGQRVKISDFTYKANIVTTNSERAIKEIKSFVGLEFENYIGDERPALGTWTIGKIGETDYGFDATDFAAVNNEHDEWPVIYWSGTDVQVENLDNSFFLIQAFVYPYFAMHTTDDEYTSEHRYDIQWMIDEYTAANLVCDDLLSVLSLYKGIAIYYGQWEEWGKENIMDKYCLDLINAYNRYNSMKYSDSHEQIGTIEAYLSNE